MATTRRRFTAQFKAKVAMEALRGDRTIQAIAAKHEVHPNQVDGGAIVGSEALRLPAAPARCLTGEALQNAADAIMGGGIGGSRVTVSCGDGGPDGADGGGRGALLGALGEVGGDGRWIGGHHLVALEAGPLGPALPRGAVLPARVRGAGITERMVDARLVGGGDRSCGRADGPGGGDPVFHGGPPGIAELAVARRYHHP